MTREKRTRSCGDHRETEAVILPSMSVPPRLVAALRQQLARQPSGAGRVGWKYGSGESERIGDEIAVGSLTTATTLEEGRDVSRRR